MEAQLVGSPVKAIFIAGKELTTLPDDLFIPPDALEILLDSFSGPLDLLLYLIKKENIDILNIPIVSITRQYLHYIGLMGNKRAELAAEYLLMAAMLAEIKSRSLLPPAPCNDVVEEQDPRLALIKRLQAYEQIKSAAESLDTLPRNNRDFFEIHIMPDTLHTKKIYPDVKVSDLIHAMRNLLKKKENLTNHHVLGEALSLHERMDMILLQIRRQKKIEFTQLLTFEEGKKGLVVSFLAILELGRQFLIRIIQAHAYSPIYLQAI